MRKRFFYIIPLGVVGVAGILMSFVGPLRLTPLFDKSNIKADLQNITIENYSKIASKINSYKNTSSTFLKDMIKEFDSYQPFLAACAEKNNIESYEDFIRYYKKHGSTYINCEYFMTSFDFFKYFKEFEGQKASSEDGKYYASFYFKKDREHISYSNQFCMHAIFENNFSGSISYDEKYEIGNGNNPSSEYDCEQKTSDNLKKELTGRYIPVVVDSYTIEFRLEKKNIQLHFTLE